MTKNSFDLLALFFVMTGANLPDSAVDIIPATPSATAEVIAYGAKAGAGVATAIAFCGGVPCGKNLYRFGSAECFVYFLD